MLFSREAPPFSVSRYSESFSKTSCMPLVSMVSSCTYVREISRLFTAQFSSIFVIIGVDSKKSFKFSSQISLFTS